MAIDSFSKFYYGHNITRDNRFLNIDEGSGELSIEIAVGTYTLSEFTVAVQSALNSVGTLNYVVSVDRASRLITISGDSNFSLLVSSGSQIGQGVWGLLGFTGADRTGNNSFIADSPSGSQYSPQFKLQDYVDSSIFEQGISTVINKTSEGAVEVVSFGRESFFEMNFRYISDLPQDGKVIKNNPNGLADTIAFFQDATRKRRFEFMPDENDESTFFKVILESTPGYNDGTGFKLRERIGDNLRDYYDSGRIKLRVVE